MGVNERKEQSLFKSINPEEIQFTLKLDIYKRIKPSVLILNDIIHNFSQNKVI